MVLFRSRLARYAVAVMAVLLSLGLRIAVQPLVGDGIPFIAFAPAVMVSAFVGGLGPGLFSTVFGALVAHYFFLEPRFSLAVNGRDTAEITVFLLVGIAISWLTEKQIRAERLLRHSEGRLARANRDLERRVAELQASRARAETAEQNAQFLAEATTLLTSSLDHDAVLDRLARLAVSRLADWCMVDVLDDDGSTRRVAVAHRDTDRGATADVLRAHPPSRASHSVIPRVLETGKPEIVTDVPPGFIDRIGADEAHRAAVRAIAPVSLMALPIRSGNHTVGCIALISAHPERRYTAADLPVAEALARRAAIAVGNARLYETARQANRLKDEFLATLSHELRTPLNAMLGWARLLKAGSLPPDAAARAVDIIERNAQAQAQLIGDILDVSRIITGKLRLEISQVNMQEVVDAAVDAIRPAADARQVTLAVARAPEPAIVSGDADRLQQVVWNLLANAVKFTPDGGEVAVAITRGSAKVQVQVRDTGEGIKSEFLPLVFDRFRQADSSIARRHAGLGLGLAIVRHLVELHGGEVTAESEGVGLGSTFTVLLPVRAVHGSSDGAGRTGSVSRDQRADTRVLDGLHILVVDDEPDARDLLSMVLERHGARVTTAGSAGEARGEIGAAKVDVLVADIGMPGEDGYQLARRLRAAGWTAPAIAVTAYARPEDGRAALEAGYQVHLCKPVDTAELTAVVAALTGRAGAPAV